MSSCATSDSVAGLRRMTGAELEQAGQQSLRDHLVAQAIVAHRIHRTASGLDLDALLSDPGCVRHPVRLVFEIGEMVMHQFAQPDIDWRNGGQDGRVLYIRPVLKAHPELVALAVAYMLPVINYGEVVNDEHCLLYGATLLGFTTDEYYDRLCVLSDFIGAETRFASPL